MTSFFIYRMKFEDKLATRISTSPNKPQDTLQSLIGFQMEIILWLAKGGKEKKEEKIKDQIPR